MIVGGVVGGVWGLIAARSALRNGDLAGPFIAPLAFVLCLGVGEGAGFVVGTALPGHETAYAPCWP